ncbi:MAG TPA: hypothetical protein VLN26_05410 [Gaiellaceae bacterium]|nr:hypothetical protein [Gaiellaceae bacterium]
MIGELRSELLKLRSTRTTLVFVLGMLAVVLLIVPLQGFASPALDLWNADSQRTLFSVGSVSTGFAGFLGILAITTEFRHGTIRPTLLFAPRRGRLVAAKVVAAMLAGTVLGLVAEGVNVGFGLGVLHARDLPLLLSSRDLALLSVGTVLAAALWAALGVGLGAAIRSQVGAIIALTAWTFVVETVLLGLVPGVGRFAPGNAGNALAGAGDSRLLSPAWGGALFVAYSVAFAALGWTLLARRDVG